MRIAIDIDSTLHHYWDELADAAKRRFGVELPYDHQHTWKISRLQRRAAAGGHRGHPLRRGHRPRAALSGRGRHRQRLARRRPPDPHHQPPRGALPPRHGGLAGGHRPAVRRPALLLRQGQPLRGARHRRPHRRQPGHPASRDRARHGGGDARASVEPGAVRGGVRGRQRRRLAGPGRRARATPAAVGPRVIVSRHDPTRCQRIAAHRSPLPARPLRAPTCAPICPASSPSARSTTGGARSASRASWTAR